MRLLAALALMLIACDQPRDLADDTNHPLPVATAVAGETPTHGFWALRRWPTLVLNEAGSCPVEAVEAALVPFLDAGIEIGYVAGECRPDAWHVEDGRVCLRTDDDGLHESHLAAMALWEYRPGTDDQITVASIHMTSLCNPAVIAHEVGHVLGLGHSDNPDHAMCSSQGDTFDFGDDLAAVVARHEAYLAR